MRSTQGISVKISKNIFRRNSQFAINVESQSEMVLQMSGNQFINNTGTAIVNLNTGGWSSEMVLQMSGNQFINNTGTAIVNLMNNVGWTSGMVLQVQMSENQFINNTGTTIVDLNTQGHADVMSIFKNIWKNNFGHAMIRFNIPKYSKTSNFFDNELTQNAISKKYPLLTEYFVNEATIVHINGNFQFKRNVFENPTARYEFATQRHFHGETIDARLKKAGIFLLMVAK